MNSVWPLLQSAECVGQLREQILYKIFTSSWQLAVLFLLICYPHGNFCTRAVLKVQTLDDVFDNTREVPGGRTKLKSQDASVNDANEKQEIRSNRQRYARTQHAHDLCGLFSASIGSQCGPKLKVDPIG